MRKVLRVFALVCFIVMLTNCNGLKAPELQSVEIADLSRAAGEGILIVNLTYNNPNGSDLKIKHAQIEGMINQKTLGSFDSRDRTVLPGKEDKELQVIYTFEADDIYPGFLSSQLGAIGSKRVRISLGGNIEFMKDDKSLEVPVDYSEVYKIP